MSIEQCLAEALVLQKERERSRAAFYKAVRRTHKAGLGPSALARELGLSRTHVNRILAGYNGGAV